MNAQAHAAILFRVAAKTVAEARAAWEKVRSSSDETDLRTAFRACVLAARASRRAAAVHDAHESARLTAEANRLDAAATDLKTRLVRAVGV